jgi:flagellar hook-associated protein 1 FlgK
MLFVDSQGLGLNQALDEFFQSFQDLANNPSGTSERTLVLQRSQTLVSVFNKTGNELFRIQKDINTQVSQNVTEVNQLTSQIADLNEKITQAEVSGQNANDFRDMRERLLNDLASHIDIQYFEDSSGQLSIFAAGTASLVEGKNVRSLSVSENAGNNGFYDVLFDQGNGNTVDITARIGGGALGGLILTRDTTLPGVRDQVDQLAFSIVTDVNAQHQAGYGLDGTTGNDLFSTLAGTQDAATNMAVTLSDTNQVAAASTVDGLPGDNTNALALVQLQNQLTMNGGKATFNGYYHDLVQGVGSAVQQVKRSYDAQEFSLKQMDNMREAVSGVSVDEEMANLMRFQRAFEASARLITLADDMLKTVIDMVR